MTDDMIMPIAVPNEANALSIGRRADRLASCLAGFGACLSIIAAIWFFLGFAENDTRPEHLTSALVLTLGLFIFAIGPFALVAQFAHQAYKLGAKRSHLLWTLLLMLPWIGLGFITATHTPLPSWCGGIMAGLASLLTIWAAISLILDRRHSNTKRSQHSDLPEDVE